MAGEPAILSHETTNQTGSAERWVEKAWWITALPLILLITIPVVMLFTRTSLQELLANIGLKAVLQAIGVSFKTTLVSVGMILLLGTPLAYLMGRHEFRYKKVLDALIDLPLVLPPSVAGLALLLTLGRRGSIGGWLENFGIDIAFTTVAVVIAQIFIAAPFYVRSASLGFAAVDMEIEQAARIDGASGWQIFTFLILPLSRFALLSGIMMSWARRIGRVWSDYNLRRKFSRPDADHADRDLPGIRKRPAKRPHSVGYPGCDLFLFPPGDQSSGRTQN